MEKFVSVSYVAKELGINSQTLYRMIRSKEIPHYRLGGSIKFKMSEIEKWVQTRRVKVKWMRNQGGQA